MHTTKLWYAIFLRFHHVHIVLSFFQKKSRNHGSWWNNAWNMDIFFRSLKTITYCCKSDIINNSHNSFFCSSFGLRKIAGIFFNGPFTLISAIHADFVYPESIEIIPTCKDSAVVTAFPNVASKSCNKNIKIIPQFHEAGEKVLIIVNLVTQSFNLVIHSWLVNVIHMFKLNFLFFSFWKS